MTDKPFKMTDFPDPAGESGAAHGRSGIRASWQGRLLAGLCALQFILLIALVWKNTGSGNATTNQPPKLEQPVASPAPQNHEPVFFGHPGPWGELEYTRINIEPLDEFVPVDGGNFEQTRWFFPGYTRTQLSAFFNGCDLTTLQRAALLNPAAWADDTNGIVVTPSTDLVLELNAQARKQIYSMLAGDERNYVQFRPYAFREGGFDDWFGQSGLSDATLALMKRLVYERGVAICFSDLPEVFSRVPDVAERRRLVKTLWRTPALLMKLRIKPDSDVNALADYWGQGWRAKDIEPLLESLAKVPGGMTIDVVHLLPPFARKYLNTYPVPVNSSTSSPPDCFWTAMNFSKDPPDDRYLDSLAWQQDLAKYYVAVAQPMTFGDLVFFLRDDGSPIHAAVYIADDVLFTKNGADERQPWVLMKMEDVLARYHLTDRDAAHVVILRLKQSAN